MILDSELTAVTTFLMRGAKIMKISPVDQSRAHLLMSSLKLPFPSRNFFCWVLCIDPSLQDLFHLFSNFVLKIKIYTTFPSLPNPPIISLDLNYLMRNRDMTWALF